MEGHEKEGERGREREKENKRQEKKKRRRKEISLELEGYPEEISMACLSFDLQFSMGVYHWLNPNGSQVEPPP